MIAKDWNDLDSIIPDDGGERWYLSPDGIDDYVSMPTWTARGDFEISFFVDRELNQEMRILGNGVNFDHRIYIYGSNNKVQFKVDDLRVLNTDDNSLGSGVSNIVIKRVHDVVSILINGIESASSSMGSDDVASEFLLARQFDKYSSGVCYDISLKESSGDNRFYGVNDGPDSNAILDSLSGKNADQHNVTSDAWVYR